MNTLDTIAARRSIRRFQDKPVSEEDIKTILKAATQAPSGKNRQPWHFYVVREDKRAEMVQVLREGIEQARQAGEGLGSSVWTAKCMEQASVSVFVFNPEATNDPKTGEHTSNVVDVQSIGAAIQNMCLAAWELGIGSLWICDVFYAYPQFCRWFGEEHELIAAISFGYADESPNARARKPVEEVTTWW